MFMRTQPMSGKDDLRLLKVERRMHCAWQSVVGGWMVVFKGNARTITIKSNRIHLAIVKRGDNIAHPALFVITETRKGLFDILVHCCESFICLPVRVCFTMNHVAKIIDLFNITSIFAEKMHLQCKFVDKSGITWGNFRGVSL